jgi:hypothetical protein
MNITTEEVQPLPKYTIVSPVTSDTKVLSVEEQQRLWQAVSELQNTINQLIQELRNLP